MGDPITVPAAPGNLNNVVVPMSTFTEVKTHHVTFVDDHKLLKHDTWDWKNDGEVFPKPEFVYGQKSAPASYTKGTYLTVMVEFEVSPPDAPVLMCTIKGSATWGAMTFEARYALKGGRYAGVFTSAQPLPDKITQLTGDINWTIDNGTDPVMSAGASWGHEIHVTVDTPKIDAQNTVTKAGEHWQMDGVTLRRMRTAMAWVEPSGTLNPHEIVVGIRKRFKKYTLVGDQRIDGKYKHPSYLNNYEGGAWPMVDYMDSSGECQAMCRLQHGILRQLGFAVSDVYVVWAEPGTDHGATAQEGKLREDDGTKGLGPGNGSRDGQRAYLVDDRVEVGKSYSTTTGPGLNRYEACLVVKDTGETMTTYYGGGADVYKDKQAVLEAFWGLVWIRFDPLPDGGDEKTYTVMEIVKRYQ